MHSRIASLLDSGDYELGGDGIYSSADPARATGQEVERSLRESVAAREYEDYLAAVSQSHSIPVMDREVDRFLKGLPRNAMILDVGGCWGWHWRRLATSRPDVGVVIVDFVRANLCHARRSLGPLIGSQVALMHADATALPFPDASGDSGFDGVWSVQVYQHIPNYATACREAYRVLRRGGRFASYSLYATPLNRAIHRLAGKPFHVDGIVAGQYHLSRADDRQKETVRTIFGSVGDRFTELLFHPDLRIRFSGRERSLAGKLDAFLSGLPVVGRLFARQRSFEATKA